MVFAIRAPISLPSLVICGILLTTGCNQGIDRPIDDTPDDSPPAADGPANQESSEVPSPSELPDEADSSQSQTSEPIGGVQPTGDRYAGYTPETFAPTESSSTGSSLLDWSDNGSDSRYGDVSPSPSPSSMLEPQDGLDLDVGASPPVVEPEVDLQSPQDVPLSTPVVPPLE